MGRALWRHSSVDSPRLPSLRANFFLAVTIVTLVIYALAIERKWHYLVILIPGAFGFSFVSVFSVTAGINYATDTYKNFPLEISFSMSITKGLWTFGLGYFINDLYVSPRGLGRARLELILSCAD